MREFEYVDPPGSVCLTCGQFVPFSEFHCVRCGNLVDHPEPESAEEPPAVHPRPDRGFWVQTAGTACLLMLGLALFTSGLARSTGTFPSSLHAAVMWMATGTIFLAGMGVGVAGVVIAFRDLKGMEGGRVDPDGRAKCVCGGILAAVSLLIYWLLIGSWVYSLF